MSKKRLSYDELMDSVKKGTYKSPSTSNTKKKETSNTQQSKSNTTRSNDNTSYTPIRTTASNQRPSYDELMTSVRNGTYQSKNYTQPMDTQSRYTRLVNSNDFQKYSSLGKDMKNPTYEEANRGINIAGWQPFAEKVQNKVTYSRQNAPALAMDTGKHAGDPKYSKMTDDEVNIYNYLLAKNGEDEADKYLKSLDKELNYRYTNDLSVGIKETSDKNKVMGTTFNLAASMLTPAAYLDSLKQTAKNKVTGKKEVSDPYSGAFGPVNMEQASREGLKEDTGKVGDFVWDTGISMGQFLTKLPMGQNAALAIMGTGAAGQTAKDVLDRGGSQDQAILSGTISGAAEIVFEKFSIEQLKAFKNMPAKNVKGIIGNTLKSFITEGSEEVGTDIANEVADRIIMSDLSQFDLSVKEYIQQGLSESDAKKKAYTDFAKQLGLSFLAGGLAGGVMGAGANVMGNYSTGRNLNQLGVTQDVINEGLDSQTNTVANQSAKRLQQQLNNNKRIGNLALGNQYNANVEAIQNEELDNQMNPVESNVLTQQTQRNNALSQPFGENNQVNNTLPINIRSLNNELTPNSTTEPIQKIQATNSMPNVETQRITTYKQAIEPITKASATFINSDSPITVKGVSSVSKNNVNVVIDDGNTTSVANINDITFNSPTIARVYANSSSYGTNGAKAYVTGYNSNISLDDYTKGFQRYYNLGKTNFPMDKINSVYSAILPNDVLTTAYYAGVNDSNARIEEQQQKVNQINANKSGIVKNEVSDNMDEDTKFVLHVLGKKSNVSIVMEEDIEGANGYYQNGEIHISKNADNPALVVYSHELTHYMEDTSPKLWKEYRDYVINYMKLEHSEEYKALEEHTKNLYRENGLDITDDEIMNEIAANATEEFLTDTKAIEKLSSENKSLAQEIIDILKGFIDKIKAMFKNYEPTSTEGKMLRSNLTVLENARQLWLETLEDIKATDTSNGEIKHSKKLGGYNPEIVISTDGVLEEYGIYNVNNVANVKEKIIKKIGKTYISTLDNLKPITNIDTGLKIEVFKSGISETFGNAKYYINLSKKEKIAKIAVMEHLAKIIKYGEMRSSEAGNYHNTSSNVKYAYLKAPVTVDGIKYDVNIDIRKSPNGENRFYMHSLEIKKATDTSLPVTISIEKATVNRSVPVTYDNSISNSTDNVNDSKKLSLKDTSDVDIKSLTEENEKLKEANELLKQQFRLTQGYKANTKYLDKMANKILKDYSSSYDKATLVENIDKLFDYISNSDQIVWDEVMEITSGMAKNVIEKSNRLNSNLYEEYSELRNDLRKTGISISEEAKKEVAYHFDSYENFRKKNFGRLLLTNDGINLDEYWGELSDKYPEMFDADTNELEQPLRLVEALDAIKPYYENPYGMDMDAAAYDLAMSIYNEYFNIPDINTFADKKAKELWKVRNQYQAKMDEIKKTSKSRYEERLKQIKSNEITQRQKLAERMKNANEADKEKYKEEYRKLMNRKYDQLQRQKATFQQRNAESRATRKEREAIKKYRVRVEKNVNELYSWLTKPTDTKHIPDKLNKVVAEFLSSIDISSNRLNQYGGPTKKTLGWQEAIRNLKDMIDNIERSQIDDNDNLYQDNFIDIDPDLIANISDFITKNNRIQKLSSLNSEQMRDLSHIVESVKKSITEVNKLHANEKFKEISALGNNSIEEMDLKKTKKAHSALLNSIDNLFNIDQMDSFSYFDALGNAPNTILHSLRKGFDKLTLNTNEAMEYMNDLQKGINTKNWSGNNAKLHTFNVKGGEVKLTIGQIMELYALNKREQARGHIYGGGIKVDDTKGKVDGNGLKKSVVLRSTAPVAVTSEDVNNIINTLTDEQKKVADGMQEFMNNQVSNWGNEVSLEMYGYKKFTEKNYYPIKSDDNYTNANEPDKNNGSLSALKNLGQTKATIKNANNPLIIHDIYDTFTRHISEMANYNAFVIPLSDAMKWYNYKSKVIGEDSTQYLGSVKQSIERTMGKQGKTYFINLMKDINGVHTSSYSTGIYDKLIANVKIASVGANIRTVLQQPTAYLRSAAMIDPKYLLMGIAKKPSIKKANLYAPIALWKSWGFFDLNTGRSMKSIITGERTLTENIKEKSLWLAGEMDNVTWGTIWNAVEFETKSKHPELKYNSEEFNKAVGDRMSEIVDRTQVVDTVFHRSQMMRSKDSLVKMSSAFMSEPNKTYNMLRNAFVKLSDNTMESKKNFTRVLSTFIITSIATSAAAAIADALRDEDKKKKWIDKYYDAFQSNIADNVNPFNLIPIVKDIVSLANGYSPSRMDLNGITSLYYATTELWKFSQGNSKKSEYAILSQTAKALSKVFGLPVGNLMREFESIYNMVSPEGIDMESETATLEKTYKTMYNALIDGDKEKYNELKDYLYTKKKTDSQIDSGVASSLVKNDSRIIEAANARQKGNLDQYKSIVNELKNLGFKQDTIINAINNYINKQKKDDSTKKVTEKKPKSLYTYDDLMNAIEQNNTSNMESIRDDMIEKGVELKSIKAQISEKYKPIYEEYIQNGDTEKAESLQESLISYFGYEEDTFDEWGGLTSSNMAQALLDNDFDTVVKIRDDKLQGLNDEEYKKKLSSLKSTVTKKAKPIYIEYVQNEEWDNMRALKQNLIDYFGYEEDTIDKWVQE